jgi:tetratricopeptide (TPR) repeat protein
VRALGERASFSFRGLQAAENLLKGALAIDPGYLDAKTELANNFLHQFETGLLDEDQARSQVLAMTDQVLAARPTDPGATALRLYVQTLDPSMEGDSSPVFDAIGKLEQLVADNPADHQIRALLGRLLRRMRQPDRALEIYLDALQHDPYNAQIHYELGLLYADLDDELAARESLSKSLELEPRQPNAYITLAEIDRRAGDGVAWVQQMLKAMAVDPQDHEIPGTIAVLLYELGLVEEGDDFRNQVFAIAPTSEIAYQVEMAWAIATGNEAASIASARRAIEDDIEDRKFAYGGAVRHLLRIAAQNDTVAEDSAWLEDVAPGILDVDAVSAPAKFRTAQIVALEAWYNMLPQEELLRRIEKLRQITGGFGADPHDDPALQMSVLAMRGETEDAIAVALTSVFTDSVLLHPGWQKSVGLAHFSALGADDRIQTAMKNWQDEQAAQSDEVRTYLANLSAGL